MFGLEVDSEGAAGIPSRPSAGIDGCLALKTSANREFGCVDICLEPPVAVSKPKGLWRGGGESVLWSCCRCPQGGEVLQ